MKLYQWGGDFYVQREGGPIGLKLAGVVAKIRMIVWMKTFNRMLAENRITTFMNVIYVDDQSWAGRALRRGVRWDTCMSKMRWTKEWEDDDVVLGEKSDKRTFRQLRRMGNTIESDIKMKEDTPSENEDGKLPVLDTKMWVEREGGDDGLEQIRYELYEKPMVSRMVTMERSSLPMKTKITVLSQEIVRWKRNTYRGEGKKRGDERMSIFMAKMKASGYTREQRWEVLKSGSRRFKRMIAEEEGGVRRINRPRWEGGKNRYVKKMLRKKNWYKKGKTKENESEISKDRNREGKGGGEREVPEGRR